MPEPPEGSTYQDSYSADEVVYYYRSGRRSILLCSASNCFYYRMNATTSTVAEELTMKMPCFAFLTQEDI